MSEKEMMDRIYKIACENCDKELGTGIDECKALTISMQLITSQIDCVDMSPFNKRCLDNICDLLNIQERTLDMLEAQSDNLGDELLEIVRSVKN